MRKRVNMKSAFVGKPKSFYNVLTFGELKIGDKFIGLYLPGDNHGHGGFRNGYYAFRKITPRVTKFPEFPDNASRLIDRSLSSFSKNMAVIKIVG